MGIFRWSTSLSLTLLFLPLSAQTEQPPETSPSPDPQAESTTETPPALLRRGSALNALASLQTSIEELNSQIAEKRAALQIAGTNAEAQEIIKEIENLTDRLQPLQQDFRSLATGIDLEEFEGTPESRFEWQEQLQQLLKPLVAEVQDATEDTRQIQDLRDTVENLQNRRATAQRAAENLQKLIETSETPSLTRALTEEAQSWSEYLNETQGTLEAAQFKLNNLESQNPSIFGQLSDTLANFFRTRGFHLLVALAIFIGVIFLASRVRNLFLRHNPFREKMKGNMPTRLLNISYHFLTYLVAFMTAIGSLYLANDWVLLTLVFIFLIGVAWGLKHTLPAVMEQIRILLNIGSIREGERVIYNDLPWRVQRLHFYTILVNPALEGARIRLPLRVLTEMISRPCSKGEVWFPSKKDDWVILDDDTYGKVVQQNPEFVQLVKLGGARKTYPTLSFLDQNPENLSHNFRIKISFGIDYAHQAFSTSKIPALLKTHLEAGIQALAAGKHLMNLQVEFETAAASSLDFAILADFNGEAAPRYMFLKRALARLAVEACNENNWNIPFTQITVHQTP